ncbi:MAG: Response regulator consisting of a CheY-like receiver domain and a DNA-binding domain [Chthonomonadales bacterium]|nr:Response regulator consisting of a CheY-like receiver domain and a DNA-binding domain [Chthonomonadales bacterium]
MQCETRIRVLVADCRARIQKGLAILRSDQAGREWMSNTEQTDKIMLMLFRKYQRDVTLMELRMTEGNALKVLRMLLNERPGGRTLVLATLSPSGEIVPALREGALDCVLTSMPEEQMAEWIRAINGGRRPPHGLPQPAAFLL